LHEPGRRRRRYGFGHPSVSWRRAGDFHGDGSGAILGAMKLLISIMIGLAAVGSAVGPVRAGEQKDSFNASLLVTNGLRQPVNTQQRQLAFDESLRQPGPGPANRTAMGGEIQPDGSVRYGDVTVSSLKNPCPPGEHVELPGPPVAARRVRK